MLCARPCAVAGGWASGACFGQRLKLAIPAGLVALVASVASTSADVIRLKNGGEVRGTVDRETTVASSPHVRIETLSGSMVGIAREHVDFISYRAPAVENYETRKRQVPDTIEARWELAEWCREQGLRSQRDEQLARIVEIDPEHEQAHRGLGHTQRNGEWMSREEDMLARGYVKHKGEWITPQELELVEQTEADRGKELEWYRQIRQWHVWLTGRNAERGQKAWDELQKITDPYAVSGLRKFFSDEEDQRLRALYIEIVSRIPSSRAASALANQALNDVDHELRYAALNGISPEQYATAMPLFIRELKNGVNEMVLRAALGLQRVGNEEAVPHLVDALVTTHTYRVWVEDPGIGVAANGTSAQPQPLLPPDIEIKLRTGQLPHGVIVHTPNQPPKPKRKMVVKRDHQNAEVLTALRRITGKDFGYDERTWELWWNAEKSGANGAAPRLE
jgi:hypothetical protein